jgi:ribosomal-protein-alanine N-acetyltransferase
MKVMTKEKTVIGYIVWEEYYDESHSHILNLAIHSEQRQKGYGKRLLDYALRSMKEAKMVTCELEVRESNHWARHLYENAGMMAVDRREGYYEPEDAIIYAIGFD